MSFGHLWGYIVGCGVFRAHADWGVDMAEVTWKEVWPV